MDWQQIYDRTVSHNLPRQGQYGHLLRSFVLACRPEITTWITEAEAMLQGFGRIRCEDDLAMLGAMVERGCLAVFPARGIADLVVAAIRSDARNMLDSTVGFDRIEGMLPLSHENAGDLSRLLALRITRNVIFGVDWLNTAARNLSAVPGRRTDITSHAEIERLEPICIMAAAVVTPFVPFDLVSRDMTVRLAA